MSNGWSQIPGDILEKITRLLDDPLDYIRVRAVSSSSLSSIPYPPPHLPRISPLPWIYFPPMLDYVPPSNDIPGSISRHHFYDFSTGITKCLPVEFFHSRVVNNSHGYLIMVNDSMQIFCYSPILNSKVYLASLSTFPEVVSFDASGGEYVIRNPLRGDTFRLSPRDMRNKFIFKIILSSSSFTDDSFIALAIFGHERGRKLAYYKHRDRCWTLVPYPRGYVSSSDVVFHHTKG